MKKRKSFLEYVVQEETRTSNKLDKLTKKYDKNIRFLQDRQDSISRPIHRSLGVWILMGVVTSVVITILLINAYENPDHFLNRYGENNPVVSVALFLIILFSGIFLLSLICFLLSRVLIGILELFIIDQKNSRNAAQHRIKAECFTNINKIIKKHFNSEIDSLKKSHLGDEKLMSCFVNTLMPEIELRIGHLDRSIPKKIPEFEYEFAVFRDRMEYSHKMLIFRQTGIPPLNDYLEQFYLAGFVAELLTTEILKHHPDARIQTIACTDDHIGGRMQIIYQEPKNKVKR